MQTMDCKNLIVFFDGECGFCSTSVRILIRMDSQAILKFSPLQGDHAKRILPNNPVKFEHLSTIAYAREISAGEFEIFTESDAILKIMDDLGGIWRLLTISRLIPSSFRNALYRLIARHRKKLSKFSSCQLPSDEERARFLD